METAYDGCQFVGIDLHRRRSVIVQTGRDGERLATTRIDNDPFMLATEIASWGEAQPRGLHAGAGRFRVGVGVAGEDLVADEILEKPERATGGGVVGVGDAPRPVGSLYHLLIADDRLPDLVKRGRAHTLVSA